jgi:outer membrane scaffolding protein for murein synthesis (MipA/OmpV family)
MKRAYAYCLILVFGAAPAALSGAELPVWEAGFGLATLTFPDYRGSDNNQYYIFPIPFFVYRGDAFKVDRNVVRGVFLKSDRIEVDTSFSGSPPVRSDQSGARTGMPDLDASIEAGPSIKYLLLHQPQNGWKTELQFPLRAVLVTDLSYLRYMGLVFNPRLSFDWSSGDRIRRWKVSAGIGPVFIDTRNSRYYYEVDPIYATPERSAYSAHGGYGGMQLALSATYRARNIWVGAFVRGDSVHHAAFEDSPLVTARSNIAVGIAATWVFGTSDDVVEADD